METSLIRRCVPIAVIIIRNSVVLHPEVSRVVEGVDESQVQTSAVSTARLESGAIRGWNSALVLQLIRIREWVIGHVEIHVHLSNELGHPPKRYKPIPMPASKGNRIGSHEQQRPATPIRRILYLLPNNKFPGPDFCFLLRKMCSCTGFLWENRVCAMFFGRRLQAKKPCTYTVFPEETRA